MTPVLYTRGRPPFLSAATLIVLAYALLQGLYVLRLPLVMDEFAGEFESWRILRLLPYRDYTPYKTVLGYYLQSIPLLFVHAVWERLLAMKVLIVVVNVLFLIVVVWMLARLYRANAVLLALALLVSCSTFLERSSELRVDMLTAWVGVVSLLLLLRGRAGWAGALCGVSFLVSQKGAFYVVAANAALAACWLIVDRTASQFRRIVFFDAAAAVVVAAYVLFWAWLSSFRTVVHTVFFAAAAAAGGAGYHIRDFWIQVLRRDPVFFLASAAGAAYLVVEGARRRRPVDVLAGVYGAAILFFGAIYPQPWPYFFVLLFPTMFVVASAWFDRLAEREWPAQTRRIFLVIVIAGGVVYPLTRVPIALARDQSYQRYNVELAARILEPSDTYVAGMSMIQERRQYPERLAWLDGVQLARLRREPPQELARLVSDLRQHPPKLVIANYRIAGLPPPVLDYLARTYTRLSGSIYLYGPELPSGRAAGYLAFTGTYLLDARQPCVVTIDGARHASGTRVALTTGTHGIDSPEPLKLRLMPPGIESELDPRFQREEVFFPSVYWY